MLTHAARHVATVGLLAAAAALAAPAGHAQIAHTPLDVPDATATYAFGLSNAGHVVGRADDAAGTHHGFLYSGGTYTWLTVPGATLTEAYGVNAAGQVAGNYRDAAGAFHGFLYADGAFTVFDVPGQANTLARNINDLGQVVGWYGAANGGHSFLYAGGAFTLLPDVPGAPNTAVGGINNLGEMAGNYGPPDFPAHSRGYLYRDGAFTFLDFPGAASTFAPKLNVLGQLVGRWVDAAGVNHGYFYEGGVYRSYDVGSLGTSGFGVNDAGQVAGWYQDAAGFHGYLSTVAAVTAPEPATLVLTAAGLCGLALAARRRARRTVERDPGSPRISPDRATRPRVPVGYRPASRPAESVERRA